MGGPLSRPLADLIIENKIEKDGNLRRSLMSFLSLKIHCIQALNGHARKKKMGGCLSLTYSLSDKRK